MIKRVKTSALSKHALEVSREVNGNKISVKRIALPYAMKGLLEDLERALEELLNVEVSHADMDVTMAKRYESYENAMECTGVKFQVKIPAHVGYATNSFLTVKMFANNSTDADIQEAEAKDKAQLIRETEMIRAWYALEEWIEDHWQEIARDDEQDFEKAVAEVEQGLERLDELGEAIRKERDKTISRAIDRFSENKGVTEDQFLGCLRRGDDVRDGDVSLFTSDK